MRMWEYAVHVDYAHIREYADAYADENLIHIIHKQIFAKKSPFLGQKWPSLALFSILSAQ